MREPLAILPLLATLLLPQSPLHAEPSTPLGEATPRVLLVGDSWAQFMWFDRSLRDVFAANGRSDIVEVGAATAQGGTTAAEWTDPAMLQLITDELQANPTIDVVQLTLGGNDFLAGQSEGGWWTGLSPEETAALFDQIIADAEVVVDHITGLDRDLQVLFSLYDFTNFTDTVSGPLGFFCAPLWNDLGQPSPEQVNNAAIELQNRFDQWAADRPRVLSVGHFGSMQFFFGFPGEGIPPGQILPPGDPTRPSPVESMRLGADCIHLSAAGYEIVVQNLWDVFYGSWFGGSVFRDGFESGNTSAWSATSP